MPGVHWRQNEVAQLVSMVSAGVSRRTCATALDRKPRAVDAKLLRLRRLGLIAPSSRTLKPMLRPEQLAILTLYRRKCFPAAEAWRAAMAA